MPSKSASFTPSKTYTYIYQTTNNINKKIYVGYHTTDTLGDGYIGCGVRSQSYAEAAKKYGLKSAFIYAVCKYGYTSFTREILEFFPTTDAAKKREEEIVNEEFVKRGDTYNIKTGGYGGSKRHWLYEHYDDVVAKFANGCTLKSIASEYAVGITIVRKVVRSKSGTIHRKITPIREKKYSTIKNELIERYRGGESLDSLRKRYGMDFKTVKKFTKGVDRLPRIIVAISPDKEIIEFSSFKIFKDQYGLFHSGIKQCLQGEIRHYKNWLFFYKEKWNGETQIPDKTKKVTKHNGVKVLSPNNEILEIERSLKEFVRKHGLCYELFSKMVNGKCNSYKGWKLLK